MAGWRNLNAIRSGLLFETCLDVPAQRLSAVAVVRCAAWCLTTRILMTGVSEAGNNSSRGAYDSRVGANTVPGFVTGRLSSTKLPGRNIQESGAD